jgi:hypothetical protein
MIRRLITVASTISLLLGMATVVLWARSYYRVDSISFNRVARFCRMASDGA